METTLIIRTNTQTLSHYDEDGASFRSGVPRISCGSSFKVKWYLYSETPDHNTTNIDFTTWKPDPGYAGCYAKFTCDNDYNKNAYGTLAGDITSGNQTYDVKVKFSSDFSNLYITKNGILTFYTNSGDTEYVAYDRYTVNESEKSVTFFFENANIFAFDYAEGNRCGATQEPLFEANHNTVESDPAKGLFVFDVKAYSRKFKNLAEGQSSISSLGFELLPYMVKDANTGETEERPSFLLDSVSLVNSIGHTGFQAAVPETVKDTMVTTIASIVGSGFEVEFSPDGIIANKQQQENDIYYRFRSKKVGGDWSEWIMLPKGIDGTTPHIGENNNWFIGEEDTGIKAVGKDGQKGETGTSITNVKQTTTSTESGGTNVITVTLSDGTQQTFNIWNGGQGGKGDKGDKGETGESFHFDAIGNLADKEQYNDAAKGFAFLDTENGNIYIKNSEASADWTAPIPFRGEQGVSITKVEQTTTSTASEGTNVITVTLSNGQIFTFNVKNGSAGKNGDKGDKGDPGVQGPSGINGITPYIGENKNWWIGENDTGVLAEGSNQFTNGIPPFEFTNADLSNGILSKTFAEMGVSSHNLVAVNIISGDGVIMDGDVRLAMIWTSNGLNVDLTQFGSITGTWKLVFAGGTKITGNGGGSGNGYTRSVLSQNTAVQSGYWYICTASGLTLTLPAGSTENYIRFSTNYLVENVVIKPDDGETIDGDSEGFTLDKASGTVEMLWIGSEWTVIEAK